MLKSILKSLTTFDKVVLIVICLIMANNVEHLAWVHYSIARHSLGTMLLNKAHSIAVVLIVELSIIVMVFKGEEFYAGLYTFFLLALSLIYYPLQKYWINGQWENFTAAVIYSCMFTLSIWYFARMAAKRNEKNEELEDFKSKYYDSIRNANELKRINNELTSKQTERNGITADTTAIAEQLLRNHILYEAWLSKKRSESTRNIHDTVMNEFALRIKKGESITLKEYLKRINHHEQAC